MPNAIADTNILIELYRRDPAAISWFAVARGISITSVTWLEFMDGVRGKQGQARCLQIIAQFGLEYLTVSDQQFAMSSVHRFRLSHGVSMKDCLIASSCHRFQVPILTKNVKDFAPLLPAALIVRPY